ncbi:MAG: hypothetical protein H0V30_04695 [Chitinophagaceae bacterium]|jgi:hypothetical protein|nr:hypothetical protein [Chitinophagaceae bacterium]
MMTDAIFSISHIAEQGIQNPQINQILQRAVHTSFDARGIDSLKIIRLLHATT